MSETELLREIEESIFIIGSSTSDRLHREFAEVLEVDEGSDFERYKQQVVDRIRYDGVEFEWLLWEIVCRNRVPDFSKLYFCAEIVGGGQLEYYSIATGPGAQTRVPREIHGIDAAEFSVKHRTAYVIHSAEEGKAWLLRWHARSLILHSTLKELIRIYG